MRVSTDLQELELEAVLYHCPMGLDKSTIDCAATQVRPWKQHFNFCLDSHALHEMIIIDLLND